MLKNKRALLLAFFLLWPWAASAQSGNLIAPEDIKEEKVNYKTLVVEAGEYTRTATTGAKVFYPFKYDLSYDKNGAKFVEYLVRKGNEVKAGDVLAVFSTETDEVALASQKMKLERAKKAMEDGIESRLEAMEALELSRQQAKDSFEREQLSLQLAYQQLALEKYRYQQENSIADMQKALNEMEQENRERHLVAPADGIITSLKAKREGDQVNAGEVLVQMYRTDGMLLQIDNSNGFFRYGMQVNVEVGKAKERTVLTGQVVGTDVPHDKALLTNKAYILLDSYDEKKIELTNPSVMGDVCRIENLIVLPRTMITMESGKHYVKKLEDGMVHKRFVQYYNSIINPTQAWIVQGLEAGETIITN